MRDLDLLVFTVNGVQSLSVRTCPTCGNIFTSRRKLRADRQHHCSLRCSMLAATRRYQAKR